MKKEPIVDFDQIHCPECKTVIPPGQTKCPNPNCPTNKPIRS
jgi:predicted nucleic acid-binding Zn ribbon protein